MDYSDGTVILPYATLRTRTHGFQSRPCRMRIKIEREIEIHREIGLEYLHNDVLVSNVSSTATDFRAKIRRSASYCETNKNFGLLIRSCVRQDETQFFNNFRVSIPTIDDPPRRVTISLTRQILREQASV